MAVPSLYNCPSSCKVWPLPEDCIHYVDAVNSEGFSLFLSALDRSYIVAMDAEWKPLSSRKAGLASPRVSVMQIACRLRGNYDEVEAVCHQLQEQNNLRSDYDRKVVQEPSIGIYREEEDDNTLLNGDDGDNDIPNDGSEEYECNAEGGHHVDDGDYDSPSDGEFYIEAGLPAEDSGRGHVESQEELCPAVDMSDKVVQQSKPNPSIANAISCAGQDGRFIMHGEDDSRSTMQGFVATSDGVKRVHELERTSQAQDYLQRSFCSLKEKKEIIFVLDMMSLPAWSFWESMKRMLVSQTVLKLGFRFKQDLVNLARSFPGPDAHSCFDKVDPYVDVGRLYHELLGYRLGSITAAYDISPWSLSLSNICEQVLGYSLSKVNRKDLQCSDWEQRPLTVEQKVYAAADAHCLLVIYDMLEMEASSLKAKGSKFFHTDNLRKNVTKGIAEFLTRDSIHLAKDSLCGGIVHANRGTALTMVRATILEGNNTTETFSHHVLIARRFGERLLANGDGSSKSIKRRPKTRRGREHAGIKRQQETHNWIGPPPWDPLCGGDGSPKFVCDVMVEGLAKQLRNVGIDTLCPHVKKSDPRKLVELAEKEGRVLLTRDLKLLRSRLIPQNLAYRVQSLGKQDQLVEVVKAFNLTISEENLLSRCTKCNGNFIPKPLTPEDAVASALKKQVIPEYAITERLLFWQCSDCRHMYWQGNQFHRALETFQAFARKIQAETT